MMKENLKHHLTPTDAITLSVIAPCYNEQDNIKELVERTLRTFDASEIDGELILVDDGSDDATWERISSQSRSCRRVRGQRQHRNAGIEAAWEKGLQIARGHLVCFIDSDLQNRPEDIAALYKAYVQQVPDLVQAVRNPVRGLRRRKLFSRGLNFLLNIAFGSRLRDHKSGFLLGRKSAVIPLLNHTGQYRYFQSFVGAAAVARGYNIVEVDTVFEQRMAGTSFLGRFPFVVSARIIFELLRYRAEARYLLRANRRKADWFGVALGLQGGGN